METEKKEGNWISIFKDISEERVYYLYNLFQEDNMVNIVEVVKMTVFFLYLS
jgi:hypothetical protein